MDHFNATIKHELDGPDPDDRPEYLMESPYIVALDTETTGNRWFDGHRPFLATASDYDRDYVYRLDKPDDVHELGLMVASADELVFHNASYDLHMLTVLGFDLDDLLERVIHDTEILARLTIPDYQIANYKLKTLAEAYVTADARESETAIRECMVSLGLIRTVEQKEIPDGAFYDVWVAYPDILEKYALADTRYTYDLYHVLLGKLNGNTRRALALEEATLPVMVRMEDSGVAVDPDQVNKLHNQYVTLDAQQQADIRDATWTDFNVNSADDVRRWVEEQGVELTEKTPSGQIAVNKWALQRAAREHPEITEFIERIFDARSTSKFISTYIGPMLDRDVVHPDFRQIGARTGRMSCMSPNMQNIPVRSGPEMRSMFVPREGRQLVVADYSSIELRLLDYYMNGGPLGAIIEEGDPFLWLGEQIFGTSDQSLWPIGRGPLKNGFYAMTYGAGGPRFAETVGGGMTPAEGRAIIKRIKKVLGPKYKALSDGIGYKIRRNGFVTTLSGREQYVNPDKAYVGLNALIQGSAADILKHALVAAARELRPLDVNLVLTVHDEIVADAPDDGGDYLAVLSDAMASAHELAPNGRLSLKVSGVCVTTSYAEAK